MMADSLPFSSLRLLIPPLRLLTEAMWDVALQQNIKYYGMLEDFVCMVTEAVPQLLTDTQRGVLLAALRAKTMLFDPEDIHTHLDRIHSISKAMQEKEPDQWQSALLTLADKGMQSSPDRQRLQQEVFNQTFDTALQSLLSDFLFRIEQMFPVPNFKQAASWLSAASSGVKACLQEVELEDLRELLANQGYSLGQATASVGCDSEKILKKAWSHPLITTPTSEVPPRSDCAESETATDVVGPVSLKEELLVNMDKKEDMKETDQTFSSVEDKVLDQSSVGSKEASSLTPVLQKMDGMKEATGNSAIQSACTADSLPFSSLRLLIPPLRLLTAAMWDVACQQNIKYYGMLEDFICMVTEAVPQLLTDTQRGLLLAALRAKNMLSDSEDNHTHPDRIHSISKATEKELDQWQSALLTLTDKVIQSSTDRQRLLQEVFNQTFDSALQSLLSDFLSRIEQMYPVPNFKQAASWLSAASSGVKACLQEVELEDLRELLANQSYSLGQATASVGCDSEKILKKVWSHPLITKLTTEVSPLAHCAEESEIATDVVGPVSLEEELVKMEVVVTIEDEHEGMEETVTGQSSPSIEVQVSNESSEESDDESFYGVMEARGNFVVQSEDSVNPSDQSCSGFTTNALQGISHNSQRVAHKCPQCGKCFIYRSQVIRHLRTNKSCSVALTTVGDVNLQDPTGGGDEEPHSHETCSPEQSSCQALSCFQCCATFRTKAELLLHQRSHRTAPVYQCGQCDKKFHHLSSLTNHKQTHMHRGGFTCSRCHKVFPSAKERNAHGLQHRPSSLTCTVCKKKFSSQMMLLRHLQSHSVEGASPRYSCRFCEKSFSGVTELRIHQRSHTCRSYQCDQCSKSYGSLAVLQSHQASHSAERRFLCPQCGKRVKTRDGLEGHMRTHTGERPYHCPYCPKVFTALAALNVHMRQHTGERPYVCTVCGKGWPSGGDLQKHMRTHTGERPYICQDCGKGFSNSCHLTEHRKIHTGEKPFSCPECGKCLRRKFDLKKHILSHSSVRPYACIFCDKSYTRKTHLNRHLRTHSTEAEDHSTNTPPVVCD